MVGEPTEFVIEGLDWDFGPDGNVEHLARHEVTPADVIAVLRSGVLGFTATGRSATHAMVGRDGGGRSLIVYLIATRWPGIWKPVTGWQSQLAHRLLEEAGNDEP